MLLNHNRVIQVHVCVLKIGRVAVGLHVLKGHKLELVQMLILVEQQTIDPQFHNLVVAQNLGRVAHGQLVLLNHKLELVQMLILVEQLQLDQRYLNHVQLLLPEAVAEEVVEAEEVEEVLRQPQLQPQQIQLLLQLQPV